MGEIADALRATLRQLSQSDARLYRSLAEEGEPTSRASQPEPPSLALEPEAAASREELENLSGAVLWDLCKAKGIKGLSKGPRQAQVEALLHHPAGPPLRSALPPKRAKGQQAATTGSGRGPSAESQALEARLKRLEQLLVLIAQQVGVPIETIDQLQPPTPGAPSGSRHGVA